MISLGIWVAARLGRAVTLTQAKWLGLGTAVVLVLVLIPPLVWLGLRTHDQGVVEQHEATRDAAAANATVAADRAANDALANRAAVAEAENDRLENAMVEAKQADPDKGTRTVGNVQQSYFDNLPVRKR